MADDWRQVVRWYHHACNLRLKRFLMPRGDMLLDAASGAVQFQDYIALSDGYRRHVCVDFSRSALREARDRLGDKALCVQADVTALPFRDDTFDAVASLHTIYHVPAAEQPLAFRELHRTLRPGRSGVVVYAQDRHPGHPLPRWIVRLLLRSSRLAARLRSPNLPRSSPPPGLYFEPLPLDEVETTLRALGVSFTTRAWRTLSVSFTRLVIPDNAFGAALLRWVFAVENLFPERCGKRASYPTFVLTKPRGATSLEATRSREVLETGA
ncbi:class I SAM-dependent methyltransferase [Candidatus Binatia bacterium]|nr:class I SAM-dependent methyltransferase [Candidatus Binatia bacterium]